jgi:membrane protein DedA with SNARE-associated domain
LIEASEVKSLLQIVTAHPYVVLFLAGLLERVGFPLLFSPVVIGAGALSAIGQMRFDLAVWIALLASIPGDLLWYELGRSKGDSVLSFLCRISFEPDSCVRRSKLRFEKGATRTLLFSKWIPGISHVVPTISGVIRIERERFLLTDTLGTALWIVVMMMIGYVPLQQARGLGLAPAIAPIIFEAGIVLLLGNAGVKYIRKQRFIRELYKARITPQELLLLINSHEKVLIVDLRHPLDSLTDPRVLPGAVRMLPEEVTSKVPALPKNEEIILYCT